MHLPKRVFVILLAVVCVFARLSFAAPAKPNIIFLLADDIGYADLSCYGAKHARTPNLDRIAAQFNGGGHACAAGLNHPEGVAQFYPRLLAALGHPDGGP